MIDLHTHSTVSDGALTPGELIRLAAERGLSALALTDHDTIDGIEEARGEAEIRGIRFIPGIELEIDGTSLPGEAKPGEEKSGDGEKRLPPRGEFHLLGLGLRQPSPALREGIVELSLRREKRNLEILDKMRALGIEAEYDEIRALSGGGSVGRPHFAAFLVRRRVVKNPAQAFSRYLAKGKPLYVPKGGLDFRRAAGIIRESGGIAVLAHPLSLYVAWGRLPDLVRDLRDQGLEGIEAWHPNAPVRACQRLEALGKALGLYITAGSDFHGPSRPDRKLGITAGDRGIDEAFLQAIPPLAGPDSPPGF
jgi:predicted metal-dependent phosphoesterase TrpH